MTDLLGLAILFGFPALTALIVVSIYRFIGGES